MDLTSSYEETSDDRIHAASTPLTHLSTRKRKFGALEASNDGLVSNFNHFSLDTPEKQIRTSVKAVPSPIDETFKILYSKLRTVKPERKDKKREVFKTKLVSHEAENLLSKILNINVIMDVVFKYLSGGDLYRFSQVSRSFYKALERNSEAFTRYNTYKTVYKDNKENYVITPPGSPDKSSSPPRTASDVFNKFIRTAAKLERSQSLTKCRKCDCPAIVDNDIIQCQNVNSCGLIYCQLCPSYSETGPKDFNDQCGHATLRVKLGNVSNCMEESFYSFNFLSQDSGFYSENESPLKVRRNLFNTSTETPKALSISNRNRVVSVQKREQFSFVPVVANETKRQVTVTGDSPPRCCYAIGSKQSRKNLKRLTR